MRRVFLAVVATLAGGCGGQYIVTAPDTVALPGQTAAVVVRLQRSELWKYAPASREASITARLGGVVRAARTDKRGYAAVGVPAPARPGQYQIALSHQDLWGDTASGAATLYVLAPNVPVAAVDLDSLPGGKKARAAAAAIKRIAARAQVVYVTRRYAGRPERADKVLLRGGYPDSAVVPLGRLRAWYDMRWWKQRGDPALAALRRRLPGLKWGISAEDDEAEVFLRAALTVLAVGKFKVEGPRPEGAQVHRFTSWALLKLPAPGESGRPGG